VQAAAVATAKAAAVVAAAAGTTAAAAVAIRTTDPGALWGSEADFANDMSLLGDDGDN